MKVVFLGSADFGIPALSMLLDKHTVAGVVSTPPRQKGRGLKTVVSPVIDFITTTASAADIPRFTPESLLDPQLAESLRQLHADCFVVVAFRILPRSLFSIPPFGTVNIHASLLPRYRGPAPIHRAIEAGEKSTGVSVFRIDDGIDTGEILLQREVSIGPQETTPDLYNRLSALGAVVLDEVCTSFEHGSVTPIVQEETNFCKAPKLQKEEAVINWMLPAEEIFNKIRAFKPFPGSCTYYNLRRLGIEWALPVASDSGRPAPGTIYNITDTFFDVQTGQGALRILTVKPEGRKSMPVHDFLNGTELREGYSFFE